MMKLTVMRDFFAMAGEEHPLVNGLLDRWGYDPESVKFVRASQNFVIRFQKDQKDYVLRIAHGEDRTVAEIESELEFLTYLAEQGATVNTPLLSKNGRWVESCDSPLGTVHAVVFDFLKGTLYEMEELDNSQFYQWGEALGELHRLSRGYTGEGKQARKTCYDHLQQVRGTIPAEEVAAHQELEQVTDWLNGLNRTEENFGLIHYDFELDNLIWDATWAGMIDFDGCASYWYVADIAFALRDLFEDGVDLTNGKFRSFIEGYRSKREIDEESLATIPMFLRMHHLVTFAMLLEVARLDGEANPQWAVGLLEKLQGKIRAYRESFQERVHVL